MVTRAGAPRFTHICRARVAVLAPTVPTFQPSTDMAMNIPAGIVIVVFAVFLIGLTGVVFATPGLAERFFMSFASSARTHFAEQAIRLLFGASLVVLSPTMWQANMFRILGWAVVTTSVGLMLLPWRWHHRFATRALPRIVRHMRLFAAGLFAFGALLRYGVFSFISPG